MDKTIDVEVHGLLPLQKQLQILALPEATRRRLLFRVARQIMRDSKKRVSAQRDLDGRPYAPRRRRRKRARKMLARLVRRLAVVRNDSEQAVLGFKNAFEGAIGYRHQHGETETFTAAKLKRRSGDNGSRSDPATRLQAIALREAGFTIQKRKKKGGKRPTLKWVTENLTIGQAGSILRELREAGGYQPKSHWKTVVPARSFLGATDAEINRYVQDIFEQITQEIRRAG